MEKIHVPVVLGTARIDNKSTGVAKAVTDAINGREDVEATLVDVKDHVHEAVTVPPWGTGGANETPTEWKKIMEKSQALVLVIPEYNHGYPGELKLLLDSLWNDYNHKPVMIVGVSGGTLGAARVIDHIKPVLIELKLHPIKEALHISKAAEAITNEGTFADEKTPEYLHKNLDELVELAYTLRPLQNQA
jgi:NAD(P)H-dependent FMN reductase